MQAQLPSSKPLFYSSCPYHTRRCLCSASVTVVRARNQKAREQARRNAAVDDANKNPPHPSPPIQIACRDEDRLALKYCLDHGFRTLGAGGMSSAFWTGLVLQKWETETLAREHLTALSLAHRDLSMGTTTDSIDTLRAYSRAVTNLVGYIKQEDRSHSLILLCCILLHTLDRMQGRIGPAQQHLDYGFRVIRDWEKHSTSGSIDDQEAKMVIGRLVGLAGAGVLRGDRALVPDDLRHLYLRQKEWFSFQTIDELQDHIILLGTGSIIPFHRNWKPTSRHLQQGYMLQAELSCWRAAAEDFEHSNLETFNKHPEIEIKFRNAILHYHVALQLLVEVANLLVPANRFDEIVMTATTILELQAVGSQAVLPISRSIAKPDFPSGFGTIPVLRFFRTKVVGKLMQTKFEELIESLMQLT